MIEQSECFLGWGSLERAAREVPRPQRQFQPHRLQCCSEGEGGEAADRVAVVRTWQRIRKNWGAAKESFASIFFRFFGCTTFDFWGFVDAKRDPYWPKCYCDTSLRSTDHHIQGFLHHQISALKFTLGPAHSHFCPCNPSLFVLSSFPCPRP